MKNQDSPSKPDRLDVIGSVDFGYRTVWAERHYLLQMAILPVILKIACLGAVMGLGWEQNFIRSSLVMLPATFAEGWMMAHLVRLILLGQRWPFRPSGDRAVDLASLYDRTRGIMAGTILYVLIKQVQMGFLALMSSLQSAAVKLPAAPETAPDPAVVAAAAAPSPLIALLAFLLLVFTIWAIRLMFLYIPVAAGGSVRGVLRLQGAFLLSVRILGIWLVSAVPCLLLMIFMMGMLLPTPTDGAGPVSLNVVQQGGILLLQAVGDTVMGLIATAAVAFALRPLIFLDSRA